MNTNFVTILILYLCYYRNGAGENDTNLVDNLFDSMAFLMIFERWLKFQGAELYIYIIEKTHRFGDF